MYSKNVSLPSGCILRRATSADKWSILSLVFSAKLDPTQLRWQQFSIIECESNVIACGQLRNFLGVQELGSLVVTPTWRGRGLGSLLTQYLISQATKPLYLECLGEQLLQFYNRFGFVPVSFENLPTSLKRKFRISQLAKKLLRVPVVFMKYEREVGSGV